MATSKKESLCGVILAGGKGRRMDYQDKGLLVLNGQTLLDRVITRAQPQVAELLISCNTPSPAYHNRQLLLLPDTLTGDSGDNSDHRGPLAGVLAAMEWCQQHQPQYRWLASFAVDTPFFPGDLCERLSDAIDENTEIICPISNGQRHPVFCLWRIDQANDLRQTLLNGNSRLHDWLNQRHTRELQFNDNNGDPFFNINTPAQLGEASTLLHDGDHNLA